MTGKEVVVLTVGHSNHPLETFVALLQRHGVTTLADVRSAPYSRFNPQFNRKALEGSLETIGIEYVFLGRALGGRPDDPPATRTGGFATTAWLERRSFARGSNRLPRARGVSALR